VASVKKMIGAGKRNKKICIYMPGDPPTTGGEPMQFESLVLTEWAAIEPLRGDEAWIEKSLRGTVTHKITMPYRRAVTPRMHVNWKGRKFHINSVIDVNEDNRELVLLATEVVS